VPTASLGTSASLSKKQKKKETEKKGGENGDKKRKRKDASPEEAREAKLARKQAKAAAKRFSAAAPSATIADAPATSAASEPVPLTFEGFKFDQKTLAKLKSTYPGPTGIQARAWPVALSGRDLIAVAKTGSGKTLAFLLPAVSRIVSAGVESGVRALCLAPTRELASQIGVQCAEWAPLCGLSSCVVYGGTLLGPQLAELRKLKPALLVATPGRLVDLLNQKAVSLTPSCGIVVLDEADRMLDMGFEPQLKTVFAALPAARQTLLFSATWPKSVRKLAAGYLRSAEETTTIFVDGSGSIGESGDDAAALEAAMAQAQPTANTAVSQEFVHATDDEKDKLLWAKLSELEEGARVIVRASPRPRTPLTSLAAHAQLSSVTCSCRNSPLAPAAPSPPRLTPSSRRSPSPLCVALCPNTLVTPPPQVFANTKRRVDNLAKTFSEFGTCAIHGDKQQADRERALADFVANRRPLMVATDVAARGLDIKHVTHVINFDMARDVESYVHRIGRTGRAGATGTSITFWNPDYDRECAPALVKIARTAGQPVPDWLAKFETAKASKLWAVSKAEMALAAVEVVS
jgi:superfamily II DNA/RNA helicase